MARLKASDIKTVSYVRMGDRLVPFGELDPETKEKAASELLLRYLNTLYRGKAVFYYEKQNRKEVQG